MFKLTKLEKNWILYDVGNSAFILLVSTILPIYFNYLAGEAGMKSYQYLAYWGYAASVVTVIVAFLGPILGTLADTENYKKKLFFVSMAVGAVGCCMLGLTKSWITFLVVFIFVKIAYSLSLIFYDSMLGDVTTDERMDKVSSAGYAWGYIGSCIPFLASLGLVLGYEIIGISFGVSMLLAFAVNGIWWFVMSVPLMKSYRQKHFVKEESHTAAAGFKRIGITLKEMRKEKSIFWFLISFFFYIDGVYTIIDMATAYGQSLGLDSTGLLLALLVTQIVAFPSALAFGKLCRRFRSEDLIMVCILAYLGISVFAVFLRTQTEFWVLAVCVGMFQGGIQALSRSYFARIIPREKSGEYFGILDICGKGAAFLGTALVSIITQITGDVSQGVSIISVLMVIGLIFFKLSVRQSGGGEELEKTEESI